MHYGMKSPSVSFADSSLGEGAKTEVGYLESWHCEQLHYFIELMR